MNNQDLNALTGSLVELHGQPHVFFAFAKHAERLADELQCSHCDWTFEPVMTPDGTFCVCVTGMNEAGDETLLGWL